MKLGAWVGGMMAGEGDSNLTEVYIVTNWFEELRPADGQLKPQIPWLRVFVEGVVIGASILLAFGLQAWWEPAPCERG